MRLGSLTPAGELWRREPYEFVGDRAAIDLLAGCENLRQCVESGSGRPEWLATWGADERSFRADRAPFLIYG